MFHVDPARTPSALAVPRINSIFSEGALSNAEIDSFLDAVHGEDDGHEDDEHEPMDSGDKAEQKSVSEETAECVSKVSSASHSSVSSTTNTTPPTHTNTNSPVPGRISRSDVSRTIPAGDGIDNAKSTPTSTHDSQEEEDLQIKQERTDTEGTAQADAENESDSSIEMLSEFSDSDGGEAD